MSARGWLGLVVAILLVAGGAWLWTRWEGDAPEIVAPAEIVGIAYDSGGVTTSTVTVPLVTALGIGLARTIHRRNVMLDGFGLIAFASLLPIAFVLGYGILVFGLGGTG